MHLKPIGFLSSSKTISRKRSTSTNLIPFIEFAWSCLIASRCSNSSNRTAHDSKYLLWAHLIEKHETSSYLGLSQMSGAFWLMGNAIRLVIEISNYQLNHLTIAICTVPSHTCLPSSFSFSDWALFFDKRRAGPSHDNLNSKLAPFDRSASEERVFSSAPPKICLSFLLSTLAQQKKLNLSVKTFKTELSDSSRKFFVLLLQF